MNDLKVFITGDISGITVAMKQALNVVSAGIEKMNDQSVDWTSIFSRAVSPAIIASVASVFAFAIEQSLQFQTAMNTAGTSVGDTTAQIGQLGTAAKQMSTGVTPSAQELANAMVKVGTMFGQNSQTTQDLVQNMAMLTDAGFGPLSDIVTASMELFKQYGATTESTALQALTSLMHAAQGAGESIPDLAKQFDTFSTTLPQADKNIGSLNDQLAVFAAEVVSVGAAGAERIFAALASSASSGAGPFEIMGQSFGKIQKSLMSEGGLSAISAASQYLDKMGPSAALVATNFGLSAQQVQTFQQNSKDLPTIATNAQNIETNVMTIKDAFDQSASASRTAQLDWNKFVAAFTSTDLATYVQGVLQFASVLGFAFKSVVTAGASVGEILMGIGAMVDDIGRGNWGKVGKDWADMTSVLKILDDELYNRLQPTGIGAAVSGLGTQAPDSANFETIGGQTVSRPIVSPGSTIAQRMNNPGDLKYAGQAGATKGEAGFADFPTFKAGWQALVDQLTGTIARHPNLTLSQFVGGGGGYSGYAPASDNNNVGAYVKALSSSLGVSSNTPISQLSDRVQQFALAVATHEDGSNKNLMDVSTSMNGLKSSIDTLSSAMKGYGGPTTPTNVFNLNIGGSGGSTTAMSRQMYNSFQGTH